MTSPSHADLIIGLNTVIIAITDEQPRVLTVPLSRDAPLEGELTLPLSWKEGGAWALPTGPLDPEEDLTLERAVRRWARAHTGLDLGYVEQLYTFGDRFRGPRGGPRVISVAYLALVHERQPGPELAARWRGVYDFLPWEDWREGRPAILDGAITPSLEAWIADAAGAEGREERRARAAMAFGFGEAPWDGDRVLERYELLFEMGLVEEAGGSPRLDDHPMALDHRRILATALGRIRGKIKYRPVIFELMPEAFTLLQLQRGVEALSGVRLHKQNFRRLLEQGGLVEGTGRRMSGTGGRPAELFRFRREVLLERPSQGVGLPGAKRE